MRARLHVRGGRIGFFREGTHDLCDASRTGQLLPATEQILEPDSDAARAAKARTRSAKSSSARTWPAPNGRCSPSSRRARVRGDVQRLPGLFDAEGVTGLVITRPEAPQFVAGRGHPHISDVLEITVEGQTASVRLRRHVAAFFQGNRFLLQPLVETVLGLLPRGELLDLYAGAGLFGVSFAALGRGHVVAVEGDRQGAEDLAANAAALGTGVRVVPSAVETFLTRAPARRHRHDPGRSPANGHVEGGRPDDRRRERPPRRLRLV